MNKINYQKLLDKILDDIKNAGKRPKLLVHSCCAPCSSYVLEYLSDYFDITVLYYNPNIFPKEEYEKRKSEQIRFINENFPSEQNSKHVKFMDCDYEYKKYTAAVRGLENEPEGGRRCAECFRLRLSKTAELAKRGGFDFFVTTLSISPLKNAGVINKIGFETGEKYGILYLPSDFKKREGYKRSIELSAQYGLYRQNFCGCVYSKTEAEKRLNNR